MRVAIYARVSTTDQDCEMQLGELRQYVQARGWDITKEFVDTGFSGKNANRPAIKECLKDAHSRKFDAIIVWKLDRWGRTLMQLVGDVKNFDSMGIRFISITQGIDTDKNNPTSKLLMHIMGAFAEFEREIIMERIAAGVKQARERGTRSGLPIGGQKKVFRRDKALEMWQEGQSVRRIASELGEAPTTIHRVVRGVPRPPSFPLPLRETGEGFGEAA